MCTFHQHTHTHTHTHMSTCTCTHIPDETHRQTSWHKGGSDWRQQPQGGKGERWRRVDCHTTPHLAVCVWGCLVVGAMLYCADATHVCVPPVAEAVCAVCGPTRTPTPLSPTLVCHSQTPTHRSCPLQWRLQRRRKRKPCLWFPQTCATDPSLSCCVCTYINMCARILVSECCMELTHMRNFPTAAYLTGRGS